MTFPVGFDYRRSSVPDPYRQGYDAVKRRRPQETIRRGIRRGFFRSDEKSVSFFNLRSVNHPGFGRSLYSVHVPATVTSMRVPAEFLEPEMQYVFEVLAIEESGNQTLSSSEFETE